MPGKKAIAKNVTIKVPKEKLEQLEEKIRKIPNVDGKLPYFSNQVEFAIDFVLKAEKLSIA